jgi:hypothetical protein
MKTKSFTGLRKFFLVGLILCCGAIVFGLWPKPPPKPSLEFVHIQPSGLHDSAGIPLMLVQFKVKSEWSVLFRNVGETIETSTRDQRTRQPGICAGYDICLVPSGTSSCYISLDYACQTPNIYNRVPAPILSRLPARMRQWIQQRSLNTYRQPIYVTRTWFKTILELQIPDELKS